MISSRPSKSPGFTLVEMVITILLLSILAGVTLSNLSSQMDSQRYEATRERLDLLRSAIVGDGSVNNSQGYRTSFGYHGDWGSMPGALSNLNTAQAPAWGFNTTYGFGVGWNGPYIKDAFTASSSYTTDAWGRNLVYNSGASPPNITSYGADGAAGGTGFNQDLVLVFPTASRLATVRGFVSNGSARLSGRTVEIRYPVAGVITAFTNVTDADGIFTFNNVPLGLRSIAVTSVPTLGPKNIVVDSVQSEVPLTTLDYGTGGGGGGGGGGGPETGYVDGSRYDAGHAHSDVGADIASTYSQDKTISYITISWTGGKGYLMLFNFNGIAQVLPGLPSGSRFQVTANFTIAAGATVPIFFETAKNPNGTGPNNMLPHTVTMTFEYVGGGSDTIVLPP